MRTSFRFFGFISLLAPPEALSLHARAKGTRSELDGLPVWLVVLAEFIFRCATFSLLVFGLQELVGRETFHRLLLDYISVALVLAYAWHTLVYFLAFRVSCGLVTTSSAQRLYRLGRNSAYSVPPAALAALMLMWWQDLRNIPFTAAVLGHVVVGTGLIFLVAGVIEALLVKRTPTGLEINGTGASDPGDQG